MKIALCLIGQPRTMEHCFPSLKKHLLDVYQPDVFIVSDAEQERMMELFNPAAIEIHSQEEIWKELGERRYRYVNHSAETIPERDLSVGWKATRCSQLLSEYEAIHGIYDIVFISRFDVKFIYINPVTSVDENTFYIPQVNAYISPPDPNGNHYGGYSAQLCWCNSRIAHILLDPKWGELYYQAVGKWHSESILKWTCDQNEIKAQHVNISMMIIRGTKENPLSFDLQPLRNYPEFL